VGNHAQTPAGSRENGFKCTTVRAIAERTGTLEKRGSGVDTSGGARRRRGEGGTVEDDVRAFGDELGRKVLARDWSGVHGLLAPWLRNTQTADDVRCFFEDEYRVTLEANGVPGLHYPEHPEPLLDGNGFTRATQLREPISWMNGKVRPVAVDVTDDSVRYWMSLRLACSDAQVESLDFDVFCEVWVAVVTTPEGLRVGYWSQGAY